MRYPVNYINIQSAGYHQGYAIDFTRPSDNSTPPVFACDNGVVYSVENQSTGGNVIYIKHDNGMCSCYAHLSKILVKKGDYVSPGEQIGNMGATGKVTGPHLHFALFKNVEDRYKNSTLDPLDYLYVYNNQTVNKNSKYYNRIKYQSTKNIKYVYNVDDEGLNVRVNPNGTKTGEVLKTATEVTVYETKNNWSRIGDNKWVYSKYLSNKIPSYYIVYNTDEEGLNIRNKPNIKGKILNTIPPNSKVQIYKTSGTWAKVSNEDERWCSKNYLKKGN